MIDKSKTVVIFDLLGVITKEGLFATKILYPLIKHKITYDLCKKKYLLYSLGMITEKEFWEHITATNLIPALEQQILANTEIAPNITAVCCRLAEEDCDLYLASEIPQKWGDLILYKAGLDHIFRKKFYSSELKTTKPFRKFYDRVFKSISSESTLIYYIDDTLINLKVAALYGAKTIHLDFNKSAPANDIASDYQVNNLDLIDIICKTDKK